MPYIIARINPDSSVDSILLEADTYPGRAYSILKKFYTSDEKVNKLIELGNLKFLGEDIGYRGSGKSTLNLNDRYCVFSYRDYKEKDAHSHHFQNFKELCFASYNTGIRTIFAYRNGRNWEKIELREPKPKQKDHFTESDKEWLKEMNVLASKRENMNKFNSALLKIGVNPRSKVLSPEVLMKENNPISKRPPYEDEPKKVNQGLAGNSLFNEMMALNVKYMRIFEEMASQMSDREYQQRLDQTETAMAQMFEYLRNNKPGRFSKNPRLRLTEN